MIEGAGPLRIVLNGLDESLPQETTIAELLLRMGITLDRVAVELDGVVIRKADYDGCRLREGARVEVVSFVGGG